MSPSAWEEAARKYRPSAGVDSIRHYRDIHLLNGSVTCVVLGFIAHRGYHCSHPVLTTFVWLLASWSLFIHVYLGVMMPFQLAFCWRFPVEAHRAMHGEERANEILAFWNIRNPRFQSHVALWALGMSISLYVWRATYNCA
ncbi:uncharacterized protein BP01DRAFT_383870 [Aspergillus saccharolyticus JOP 1030-1]|uniref:Uncharacterized protein n=1 Tax=Aspergillus saccharolyticus JOP 1030-1 TaxID=1450539 RepID=A0A318ZC17_9EURO|nr:hypothetical protein BP01DRAFT_383870 [Aspergillus saccharolyticus JOP 1030-1]PYH44067.1 hypothetical protein BP01DRAFT_383870 [Aspergillus saccharolyticus JOP 1030-1]